LRVINFSEHFSHHLKCKFFFLWMYWKCFLCQTSVAASNWQLPPFILYGILYVDIQFPVFLTFKDSSIPVGYFAVLAGTKLQTFRRNVSCSFSGSSSARKVTSITIYQHGVTSGRVWIFTSTAVRNWNLVLSLYPIKNADDLHGNKYYGYFCNSRLISSAKGLYSAR
jgi:hypothetical protein